MELKTKLQAQIKLIKEDKKKRNKFLIIAFSSLFILDYFAFSFMTDKNILNVFPNIPKLKQTTKIKIFLPYNDGKTILTEEREIPTFNNDKKYVRYLFNLVVKGSNFENTRISVPVSPFIKTIWIKKQSNNKKLCVIDLEPLKVSQNRKEIPGSEENFKKSLFMTIKKNIPSIEKISILENGVASKKLW